MTRIITEGFLDYPFHIMLKPYLYQPERYPQCLEAVNRMLVRAYLRCRNALVVEHEGRVVAVALMLAENALCGRGACRVHGGGFAGTVQAFVPLTRLDSFKAEMEAILGKGRCHILSIRPEGGAVL